MYIVVDSLSLNFLYICLINLLIKKIIQKYMYFFLKICTFRKNYNFIFLNWEKIDCLLTFLMATLDAQHKFMTTKCTVFLSISLRSKVTVIAFFVKKKIWCGINFPM